MKVLNSTGNGIIGDIGTAIDWCKNQGGATEHQRGSWGSAGSARNRKSFIV